MSMLGPSLMYAGTPLALGVSIFAFVRAIDRPFAAAAFVMGSLEAIFLAAVIVLS